MPKRHWFWYFREYYLINRSTWPSMGRVEAAWDAFRLAIRVR